MKLENITITATIDGEPVMVILDKNQTDMLPDLIAACDQTGKCRVTKLDPNEYTLSKPSFANSVKCVTQFRITRVSGFSELA